MPNQRLLTPLLRRTLPLNHRSLLRLQPLPFPSPSPPTDHFPNPRVCDPVTGIGFSGSREKKFDIELGGLEGKYKEWQKKLHPDLVHSKSESARVIDAYRTLSDPLSRAVYLMMEIREAVDEAAGSQGLRSIQTQVHEKQKQWAESFFSKAFQDRNTDAALNSIRRLTYCKRADEEILKKL
ncbi:Iron-sulfur cluster co-chaperone protein HscB-like protein [Drosera capensis]